METWSCVSFGVAQENLRDGSSGRPRMRNGFSSENVREIESACEEIQNENENENGCLTISILSVADEKGAGWRSAFRVVGRCRMSDERAKGILYCNDRSRGN